MLITQCEVKITEHTIVSSTMHKSTPIKKDYREHTKVKITMLKC